MAEVFGRALRQRERELALALWRRDHGLRREPTPEALEVYRTRARAHLKRKEQEPMAEDAVMDRLRRVIHREMGAPETPEEITEQTRLREDLDADSLDEVEVCMAIEEEFAVEISDDEWAEHASTVGGLAEFLRAERGS